MPSLLDRCLPKQAWQQEPGQSNGAPTTTERVSGSNGDQTGGRNAGTWAPTVVKMVAFKTLGDDWDGQGAQAPNVELLASAVGLAYTLHEQGVDPPSRVVPGPDGSVIFEWQDPDGTYTELEVVRPFFAEVMMIEPGRSAKHWTLPTE